MTLEEEYILSLYEELIRLKRNKPVWLVRHVETGHLYVKKYLPLYSRGVCDRLALVHDCGLPQIHFLIQEEDHLTIIEDYIHGRTVEEILEEDGVFSLEAMCSVILPLCRVLGSLHSMNPPLIHRDIKPSNIMVSSDGVVKLIDFNAARELSAIHDRDTHLMGTPEYAAPEQYGFGQSDARTDIYGLGITINRMLTGELPETRLASDAVGEIVQRCTRLSKQERYPTVEALACDLESVRTGGRKVQEEFQKVSLMKRPMTLRDFVPVGFRSKVWWKMLVGAVGYGFILFVCFDGKFTEADGTPYTGLKLLLNQVCMLFILLGYVAWGGDYLGIRKRLLGTDKKNKKRRLGRSALYLTVFTILIIFVLVLVENCLML